LGSALEVDAVSKWYFNLTSNDRIVFRALESEAAQHPGKTILITGVDDDVFLHTVAGGADRTLGIQTIWLPPGQDAVLDGGRLPNLQRFRVDPGVLTEALRQNQVRVLEISGVVARDVTDTYRAAEAGAGASN
ncbi:MAG: hypothetical protein RL328_2812, partial [Acidobacteriota bacterium]